MEEKYFGRLPKDPRGWTVMTRDGHFGFIDGVEGDKVMTTSGTFPVRDVIVRHDVEVGDIVTYRKKHHVVTARTLTGVSLLSEKGRKDAAKIYDVRLEGWFYPGERVGYNGKEYTYAGRICGVEVLKNNDGLEYAREENIRALDTDKRMHGGITPDFDVLSERERGEANVVCRVLIGINLLRKDGMGEREIRKLLSKKI